MATEAAGTSSVAVAEVAAGSGAGRGLAPPPARIAPMSVRRVARPRGERIG